MATPRGLGKRGRRLWDEITEAHELDPSQTITLEEACRCADRLDGLDDIISGRGVLELMHFRLKNDDVQEVTVTVDNVLAEARQQQNILKQLLAALRLPDAVSGKKPQQRGPRGAYAPSAAKSGSVSSLERARAAKAGA